MPRHRGRIKTPAPLAGGIRGPRLLGDTRVPSCRKKLRRPQRAIDRMATAVAADPGATVDARLAAVGVLHRWRWGLPPWPPDVEAVAAAYGRRPGAPS